MNDWSTFLFKRTSLEKGLRTKFLSLLLLSFPLSQLNEFLLRIALLVLLETLCLLVSLPQTLTVESMEYVFHLPRNFLLEVSMRYTLLFKLLDNSFGEAFSLIEVTLSTLKASLRAESISHLYLEFWTFWVLIVVYKHVVHSLSSRKSVMSSGLVFVIAYWTLRWISASLLVFGTLEGKLLKCGSSWCSCCGVSLALSLRPLILSTFLFGAFWLQITVSIVREWLSLRVICSIVQSHDHPWPPHWNWR